jgi:DNA-binding transcriptional ArsR family regulator
VSAVKGTGARSAAAGGAGAKATGSQGATAAQTGRTDAVAAGNAAAAEATAEGAIAGPARPDEHSELVEQANRVFSALADPTRRQVLQLLAEGPPLSASALAGRLPISRQAVVQHLAVLQQSELVGSRRAGREVLFSVRPEALTQTASWMNTLAASWSERLQLLKRMAEAPGRRSDQPSARPADRP